MELRPDNNEGSDLLDPLADVPPSSLFSRSLNLSSSSNPNSSISDSFDAKLKARVLSSPNRMFEQARTILEGSADHLNADKTDISTKNEKVPRGKRPGLGLKPPKFVMKPMLSEPDVISEHSVDFSKLSDPDEYFDAFERLENAKKEMRRLRGEPVLNLNLNCVSMAPRPKRPSLLGKSVKYTHRTYPSIFSMADVNENRLPSQETLVDAEILSSARHDVVPDANVMNNNSSNSKATTTGKVSELDEMLALNFEGLDDDGIQNLLLEKLQIKPVDIDNLPDWRASMRKSLTATTALPKTNDKLNHLSGASKAVSRKDMRSPAKSRSPLASISMLNRHIAKRNAPNDLFQSLCFDSSPEKATNTTREPEKGVDQAGQSDNNALRENMCKVRRSPVHEEDSAVTGEDLIFSVAKDVDQISEPKDKEVVIGQLDQVGNQTELHEDRRSLVHGKENILVSDVGPTSQPEKQNNEVTAVQGSAEQQFIFEAQDMENSSFNEVEKDGMDEPSNVDKSFVEELTKETMRFSKRKSTEKGKSETLSVSEEPAEKGRQAKSSQTDVAVSKETRSKRRKVEGAKPGVSKGDRKFLKEGGRRFSLYYAGTAWDAGVRRSTRMRMKPLDFWSKQRYLYARVHESLPTAIGVKYASPSKETEPEIKVKSFVSDEHKDLVYSVSMH